MINLLYNLYCILFYFNCVCRYGRLANSYKEDIYFEKFPRFLVYLSVPWMRDSIIIGIMELALLTLSLLAATFVVC